MNKLLKVLLAVLMVLTMTGCTGKPDDPTPGQKTAITNEEFDALMLSWFKEDIGSDYMSLHFAVEDPSVYGIATPEVTLGSALSDDEDTTDQDRLPLLNSLDTSELGEDQLITYKTLVKSYETMVAFADLEEDYGFAFTPNSGINNNLTTYFTEFDIRKPQEAVDLIALVKDSKRYVEECIDYTKEQFEKGIAQPDSVINDVLDQCKRFIEKREDNEVITVYSDRLDELGYENAAELKSQMQDAVLNYLIPAYEEIIEMYEGIKGTKVSKGAMSNYGEGGKAYYEALFAYKSSSSLSVSEWKTLLRKAIREEYNNLLRIYSNNADDYANWSDDTDSYGLTDAYEIFTALQSKITQDFPAPATTSYVIDFLDPSVASENVAAYYLVCPIDNIHNNVVKANPAYGVNNPNEFVATLSHEGFPGHLYQNTFYYFGEHPNKEIRYNTSFIGWSEGWAMYVEDYCYGYFAKNTNYAKLSRCDNALNYYLEAYLDILVNYEGYTVSKLASEMENLGFNGSAARNIYSTLIGDPALFVPYSCGLYQMRQYNELAKSELGDAYNSIEYHTLLLNMGETHFDVMSELVNKWIEDQKTN